MAYINAKTFDIVHIPPASRLPEGFFYVDDVLADTIQTLNLRGYETRSCHAGAPFGSYREATLVNVRETDGGEPAPEAVLRAFAGENPSVRAIDVRSVGYRAYRISMGVPRAESMQITFRAPYRFSRLPEDFEYADRVLRHEYPAELQGIDFLTEQLRLARSIYTWAWDLPLGFLG